MTKKLSFRAIFTKLKDIGVDILNSEAPIVSDESELVKTSTNNYETIFKQEYNKSSDSLKKIINNKTECYEFNQFIKLVINKSEN